MYRKPAAPALYASLVIILLIISVLSILTFVKLTSAQQGQPRFLVSPYYGETYVTSWFDHRSPNYTTDSHLLKYTGEERDDPHNEIPGPPPTDIPCDQDAIYDNCYDGHNGIDFGLSYKQVLAASSGTVSRTGWDKGDCHECDYGLVVEIQHNLNGITYRTRYGHLTTIAVEQGDFVSARDVIGTSGSTGASSGPHLHFDVYICIHQTCNLITDWIAIDPFGWQPVPGGIQTDPWLSNGGHQSWCMWSSGQWVNICDPNQPSRPLPTPVYYATDIIDDSPDNSDGFYKGYGGLWNNFCTENCEKWWRVTGPGAGYLDDAYRTIASGDTTPSNWAGWFLFFGDYYTRLYEVFVYTPGSTYPANTFTWQARYYIYDANFQTHTAIVDEYVGDGQNYNPYDKWRSIGVYLLDSSSYIYTTDASQETSDSHCPNGPVWPSGSIDHWCRMLVDGVKIAQVGRRIFLPAIQKHIPMANDPLPGTPSPTPTFTPTPTLTPTPPTPYP